VSLVSLAATFLDVAGIATPTWSEGLPLPLADEHVVGPTHTITEWDSALFGVDVHVRTVVTETYAYTAYLPGSVHDGTERELYVLADDPLQRENRATDANYAVVMSELDELLHQHAARPHQMTRWAPVVAPV
jgi:hypothetical protein